MKTKKKVIRLTESDLHNMISEAVKQALNELDPRTYASYATKRQKQAMDALLKKGNKEEYKKSMNKAKDGRKAASDAWNKIYSNVSDEESTLMNNWKNLSRLGQRAGGGWDTFDDAKLMIFSETFSF